MSVGPSTLRETIDDDKLRGQDRAAVVPRSYLFVVMEGHRPFAGGARFALEDVDEIVIGRGERRATSVETRRDGTRRLTLSLASPLLSRVQARLQRDSDGWVFEDAHSRNGSYLNGERVARGRLGSDDVLEVGHTFLMIRAFPQRLGEPVTDLDSSELEAEPPAFRTLIPTVARRLRDLRRLARSSLPILLCGETGTGKEVLARALHQLSGRRGPFVAINCCALTTGLAESQLFGHVKGAFSGAVGDSVGFVRSADGGTLLLDEVGDLTAAAQGALLRVIQEQEVIPVGRARPEAVNVRFLSTTPRPLDPASEQDRFRSDLFARLSGHVHFMTPLRERREDVGFLAAAILQKVGARDGDGLRIPPGPALALIRHGWSLNVRELEQVLARARLLEEDGLLAVELGDAGGAEAVTSAPPPRPLSDADKALQARVAEALAASKGNVSAAARTLGKGRVRVHRLMRRLQIDPRPFRN